MALIITESEKEEYILIPKTIEKYLNTAKHEDLKVILWLYANQGKTFDTQQLAELLAIDEDTLERSVSFWISKKLLSRRGERLIIGASPQKTQSSPHYTGEAVNLKLKENYKLLELIEKISENLYTKVMSPSEVALAVSLNDWLGLDPDVIYMIFEYCFEIGKTSLRYIEKTAISFSDKGLTEKDILEAYLNEQRYKKTLESKIVSALGIGGRALTDSEKKAMDSWVEWGFDVDIVKYAYELTIEKTGKYSISYMSSILRSWNEKGYKTVQDAKKEQPPVKKTAVSKPKKERNIDVEESFKNSWKILHSDKD
ncbi:MAG: DnaD domain protein [Ruminococcaceae bacterium]|nr:DnaD domain protein [Oscillospiraceae bacterium]MBE6904426.1 DnaD domain protein [Oscillospiraceae bacterium]